MKITAKIPQLKQFNDYRDIDELEDNLCTINSDLRVTKISPIDFEIKESDLFYYPTLYYGLIYLKGHKPTKKQLTKLFKKEFASV
jgi:hypothetical protein